VDPEKAKATPFGSTIAHGYLTVSLLPYLQTSIADFLLPKGMKMGMNYGFDKLRFMSPVRTGKRIRGSFKLAAARFRGAGMLMNTYEVTVEIEGERKPALTADWITISQFDPKDRPDNV